MCTYLNAYFIVIQTFASKFKNVDIFENFRPVACTRLKSVKLTYLTVVASRTIARHLKQPGIFAILSAIALYTLIFLIQTLYGVIRAAGT